MLPTPPPSNNTNPSIVLYCVAVTHTYREIARHLSWDNKGFVICHLCGAAKFGQHVVGVFSDELQELVLGLFVDH